MSSPVDCVWCHGSGYVTAYSGAAGSLTVCDCCCGDGLHESADDSCGGESEDE